MRCSSHNFIDVHLRFLYALSLFGFGAAHYVGAFPNLSKRMESIAYNLLVFGGWVSFISECYAAKTNIFLPLGAEKSGAEEGEDLNVTIVKVAGVTMGVGAAIMCSGIDHSLIMGGSCQEAKKK